MKSIKKLVISVCFTFPMNKKYGNKYTENNLLECYRLDRKKLEKIMGADDSWLDEVFETEEGDIVE